MVGYVANLFAEKSKIPESISLIALGFLIGPVFKVVNHTVIRDFASSFTIFAIVILLIDNGLESDIPMLFKSMLDSSIFTLSVNLLITILTGYILHTFFGWNLLFAYFIGIFAAGTTTIILPYLFKDDSLINDAKKLISLESILNDTSLIIIAVAIMEMIKSYHLSAIDAIFEGLRVILVKFSKGILFAIIFFALWFKAVKAIPSKKKRDYVFILGLIFVLYSLTELMEGSGIIAVLTFSILIGNVRHVMNLMKLKEKKYRKDHIDTLKSISLIQMDFSFFTRSLFFVVLGLISDINGYTFEVFLISFVLIVIILLTRYTTVKLLSKIEKKYSKFKNNIFAIVPKGFIATLLVFLPYSEKINIPHFPEIAVIVIISTALISIWGNKVLNVKKSFVEKATTDFKD